jgi:hypothetical protein
VKKKAAKKKYRQKISLCPLTPDEALRAALHTPPPPKALLLLPPKKKTGE